MVTWTNNYAILVREKASLGVSQCCRNYSWLAMMLWSGRHSVFSFLWVTVEPHLTDSCLIRTSPYYGQFSLSLGKALTFSLNSTRLIQTPINADNGHLFLAQSTDSHRKLNLVDTSLSTVCHNSQRPFLSEGEKTFIWQHVDVPSTTVHSIGWVVWVQTFADKEVMQRTVLIK